MFFVYNVYRLVVLLIINFIYYSMLTISEAISNTGLKSALIPFITAGYPNIDVTLQVIQLLDKHKVNAIELGIPYSDALADGSVIQESSRIALEQKTYIDQVLILLSKLSSNIKAPIIIFTYFNPILSRGLHRFIEEIYKLGVKGLVVPDLPLEESDYLIALCSYYNIELILFVSPSSSESRIKEIVLKAPGCIYLVSSYGVTGLRSAIELNIQNLVQIIKHNTNKSIMLGFGISNEKQVAEIINLDLKIDAIVMGSAFINYITSSYYNNSYEILDSFCNKIKNVINYS